MSEEINIAAADSLLGKLQRGRGAGFLGTRRQTPSTIWPLLVECITRDPRLDRQVESRDDFYAALVIETGMELKPLATHLREHDDTDQSGWNTTLTVTTLGSLAKRNYQNAVDILRDYVAWGNWWNWAIDELVATQNPLAWANLDEVFCKRFSDDEALNEELGWFSVAEDPWKTWCKQNTRLNQFIGSLRQPANQFEEHDFKNLSVADVLQLAGKDARVYAKLRKIITHLVKPADFDFLLSQVSIAEPNRSGVALAGLAKLANPAMFDWLIDFWAKNPEMPVALRVRAEEAILSLPPARTLPLARSWLNHDAGHFRSLAEDLMKSHATPHDVPLLRKEMAAALVDADNQIYRLCDLIEAFKRLPGLGRLPELESVFVEFRYSYGRSRAAEALLAVDKEYFVRTHAQECLWDCEDRTRALGCEAVDLADKTTNERIKQLSTDVWEDKSVRNAATQSLSS
ncbi:MAG: hypothetical protein IH623_13175 [Verrucomicrobia bacterium]|nr:hypothetical protein [Verrucomicrobiota bacterium]